MLALRFAARSDIGLGRYVNNQDSGYAGPHLLAVCDGMGGHAAGDIASSLAIARLVSLDGESHGADAATLLEQAVLQANADLRERITVEPSLRGMGTTTTALLLHGDRLALTHIGDSRCYLLREEKLATLTHDHTFVQSLVDDGKITPEEAERHPQRSVITRVLTGDANDSPDISVRQTQVGDRYVVCSDGLTGVVSPETLTETLLTITDPGPCAEALIALALRAGGADNITCVVAEVVDPAQSTADVVPQVVGSAAVHGTVSTTAAADSPAAKAAALNRTAADPPAESAAIETTAVPRRPYLGFLLGLIILAIISGGCFAAYTWSQRQYFIGADGDQVAIFRGLPQDIGPLRLSKVVQRPTLGLSTLPELSADQVRATITVDNLAAAELKVSELQQQVCLPPNAKCAEKPS